MIVKGFTRPPSTSGAMQGGLRKGSVADTSTIAGPLYGYLLKVSPIILVRESHKWTEQADGPLIVVTPDCTAESMSQPSPAEPLFCALCAAPCLEPRIDTPPPSAETSLSSDTTDSHPLSSDWLRSWHLLQVSSGLVDPVTPSSAFHSSADASATALNVKRTTPIHAFCLQCVMRTVRRTMYGGFSHEERMMLGWSLPKWTGHGPWVGEMRGDAVLRGERGLGAGYWGGTPVQRERWRASGGAESGHLVLVRSGRFAHTVSRLTGCRPTAILPWT